MNNLKKVVLTIATLLTILSGNSYANGENDKIYTFTLNEFGNYFSQKTMSKTINIKDKRIQPGSLGYFDIIIDSKNYFSDINYNLKFSNLKNKPKNLYFIIDNKKISNIEKSDPLEGCLKKYSTKHIKRIYWKWDYENEEEYDPNRKDFTFDMNLIVERKEQGFLGKKLPRTGNDITVGIVLAILVAVIIYLITIKIYKENNKINEEL